MVLVAILGKLGSGKTLALTKIAYKKWKQGKKIYSNYHLTFPYIPVKKMEDIQDMKTGCFFGDELWAWLDSRSSMKEKNKAISSILLKSRKRGISIYYTTQSFMQMDVRIRRITDFIVEPILSSYCLYKGEEVPLKCILNWYVHPEGSLNKTQRFFTVPYFSRYDTNEEIGDLEEDE